jgi:hypothetical protein
MALDAMEKHDKSPKVELLVARRIASVRARQGTPDRVRLHTGKLGIPSLFGVPADADIEGARRVLQQLLLPGIDLVGMDLEIMLTRILDATHTPRHAARR